MNSHTEFHQVQFETFEILNPGSTRVDYCKTLDEKLALEKQTMEANASSLQSDILEQWETEKGNTHPHESITQLFESEGKAIDKFMQQRDMSVDHKTNINILKTTLSQLKLYEQESLGKEEASASEDVRNYIVFEKMYSYRKNTLRNPDFNSGRCKEINALIKETKDVQNKYFTKINGLREEISSILNAVARFGNYKEKWLRMQCQSFASHHVFALYAAKIQMCLNELNVKNMLMKNESKQKRLMKQKEFVICECGESTTRSNLSKHPSFKIHQKLMAMKTSEGFVEQEPIVVLCEEIRIPVKVMEPETEVLVVEEIPKPTEPIVLKFDFGFVPAYDDETDPEEYYCKAKRAAEVTPVVNYTKTAIEADREAYETFFTDPDNDPVVCMRMHYKKLLRVFDEMNELFSDRRKEDLEHQAVLTLKELIENSPPVEEQNTIVPTPSFETQQPVTNDNDDDDDDDDDEMNPEVDEETQQDFDELQKDIEQIERKKPPPVQKRVASMRELTTKYHHILSDDEYVIRSTNVITSLLNFKGSINERSSLAHKIDDLVEDKLFKMFKEIKERYSCGLPSIDFLDAYGKHYQGILLHPRMYEIMDNGMTPKYEPPQTKLISDYKFDNVGTEYWALLQSVTIS